MPLLPIVNGDTNLNICSINWCRSEIDLIYWIRQRIRSSESGCNANRFILLSLIVFQMENPQPLNANELTVEVATHHTAFNYSLNRSVMLVLTMNFHRIIRSIVSCRKHPTEFYIRTGILKTLLFKRGHELHELLCLALRNHRNACLDLTRTFTNFNVQTIII